MMALSLRGNGTGQGKKLARRGWTYGTERRRDQIGCVVWSRARTPPSWNPLCPRTPTARSVDPVTTVLDEAIMETIGTSRKKWALVVVAFVAGALGVLWLTRRAHSHRPATVPADASTS